MQVNSLADFRDYIRLQLGYCSVNIPLTDNQLNSVAYDSTQLFFRYLWGESDYEDYSVLTLSAGVSAYSMSGADITSIIDIQYGYGATASQFTRLFTPASMLFGSNFYPLAGGGNGMALTSFEVFNDYMFLLDRMFGVQYRLLYNEMQQILRVIPTPTENLATVIKVYRKSALNEAYNHPLVKALALAKAKKIASTVYMQFGSSLQMPGGGDPWTFGKELRDEAKEEEKEYTKKLQDESNTVGFVCG